MMRGFCVTVRIFSNFFFFFFVKFLVVFLRCTVRARALRPGWRTWYTLFHAAKTSLAFWLKLNYFYILISTNRYIKLNYIKKWKMSRLEKVNQRFIKVEIQELWNDLINYKLTNLFFFFSIFTTFRFSGLVSSLNSTSSTTTVWRALSKVNVFLRV